MKNHLRNGLLGVIVILSFMSCSSRAVITSKPVAPVVAAPPPPYPGAVWVAEDWRWRRGRYVYVRPHYVRPVKARIYAPGYWRPAPRGYVWVRGRWR